jgi:hypothetical protein
MSFVALNGYDVEHASSMLVYENLFPEIQHINGKGVIDKYTKTDSVESVTYIDVMRVLPYAPRFRQLGALNNGKYHNAKNVGGYNNAPQSQHYTIPVDLIYDEGVAITDTQIYSNPIALKQVVLAQLVKTAGMSINIITYAKQIEGFFRNGDNFDKALTHQVGSIVAGDITDEELASAVFAYDGTAATTAATYATAVFQSANESLNDGIPEIGAFTVPSDERQGFITPQLNRLMKAQYMQNASEASARILANGFINPFNAQESNRIDSRTGMCGMYDGVDLFLFNKVTRKFVYVALGILGTADDTDETLAAVRALLDKWQGMIVYGAGTCRGIVGPSITANPNVYFGGVYILPKMKVGVEVLHGGTIKLLVDGGASLANAWTKANVATIMNTIKFTPIDGSVVKGDDVVAGFNNGSTN